jgi:hypothetical protein
MIYADMSNENQNNQEHLLRDGKYNISEEKIK